MDTLYDIEEKLLNEGYALIDNIFTIEEVNSLLLTISQADTSKPTFSKNK